MMARNFNKSPSEFWGIEDLGVAFDFDRLCNLRLMFYDAEILRLQAEAVREPDNSDNGLINESAGDEMIPRGTF